MMIAQCKLIEPFFCKNTDTVQSISQKLGEFSQRHIYVVDAKNYPVGIISITDLVNRVLAKGLDPKKTLAQDIMTTEITIFDDEQDAKEAYSLMIKNHVVSVPVVQDGKYIGTLTYNEALRYMTTPNKE